MSHMRSALRGRLAPLAFAAGVLAALGAATTGCPDRNNHKRNSENKEIVNGGGAADGPDASGGSGLFPGIENDFTLMSDLIVVNVDAVGTDEATTPFLGVALPNGSPLQSHLAPSGGNIVDIEFRGKENDRWLVGGVAVNGTVDLGADGAFGGTGENADTPNSVTSNIVFNFDVLTDREADEAELIDLNPFDRRTTRRLLIRGVIANTSGEFNCLLNAGVGGIVPGTEQNFLGTETHSVEEVQDACDSGAFPAEACPPELFLNAPPSLRIVTGPSPAIVPVFVTTVLSLTRSSTHFAKTTVVTNPSAADIAIGRIVDVTLTSGASDDSNMDVFVPGFLVGDLASGTPPQGVFPWVTFMGRGDQPVSYTLFDSLIGQVVVQRPAGFLTGVAQLRSCPIIAAGGDNTWIRRIAVGRDNDVDGSAAEAIRVLTNSPVREAAEPCTGAVFPLPNWITDNVGVSGQVKNAEPGTLVVIEEIEPRFIFYPAVPGLFTNLLPGNFPVPPFARTTTRVHEDGSWAAVVPVGFQFAATAFGGASDIDLDESTYQVRVLAPGKPSAGVVSETFTLRRGASNPGAPSVDLEDAEAGRLTFIVTTDGGLPSPAKITIVPQNPLVDPVPDLSQPNGLFPQLVNPFIPFDPLPPAGTGTNPVIPGGLNFGLTRAAGTANVIYTSTGVGSVCLPVGTYLVIASRGIEFDADQELVSIGDGSEVEVSFDLPLVVATGDAISFDAHVHADGRFDSSVPGRDRLISYLGTGVDCMIATEHDLIVDYRPELEKIEVGKGGLEAEELLATFPGTEATAFVGCNPFTYTIGHRNAFPLDPVPGARRNGLPEEEFRPPRILIEQLRAQNGLDGEDADETILLTHPRGTAISGVAGFSVGFGYFRNLTFESEDGVLDVGSSFFCAFQAVNASPLSPGVGPPDDISFASPISTLAIALLFNGFPLVGTGSGAGAEFLGSLLAESTNYDAIEVWTGSEGATELTESINDWLEMMNHGIIRTGLANTDTHVLATLTGKDVPGFPRNYKIESTATPATLDVQEIVAATKPAFEDPDPAAFNAALLGGTALPAVAFRNAGGGKVFGSAGPFITVVARTVDASGGTVDEGTIGDFITADTNDAVAVDVTVDAPPWIFATDVEVRLKLNGVPVIVATIPVGTTVTITPPGGLPLTAVYGPFPAPYELFADVFVTVEAGLFNGAAALVNTPAMEATPLGSTFDLVAPGGVFPFAFTNPIFIDRASLADGGVPDGVFDPPGPLLVFLP